MFRKPVFAAILSIGLFLAACDSNSTGNSDKDPDTNGTGDEPNGTLTVDGKSWPALVAGLYDDTSATFSISNDLDDADTGWSLILSSEPSKGTHPLMATVIAGSHNPNPDSGCVYITKSGSITLDKWSNHMAGSYEMATFSGTATAVLTKWILVTDDCPDVTVTISFKDAEAANVTGLGEE